MKMFTRRESLALAALSAAILFDALDLSITQVALPKIGDDLGLASGALQWVPNAYVLTYGGLLLLGGRLADVLGRRRTFLGGLVLFGAMSLICGLAANAALLVAARAVQGIGAALTVPAAVSIIAATFAEGTVRNRAMGIFGASAAAGFSVGLVLGGVLTDALSWRWIFLVKVPVVLAAAVIARRAVEEGRAQTRPASYDIAGALSSVSAVLLLVLGITQLGQRTLPVPLVAAAGVTGTALLVAFAINEHRAREPLLPPQLLSLPTVRAVNLASLTVLAAPFGLSYVTTLWMQEALGYSALATGFALLPGAALSIATSRFVTPALVGRFGLRASASAAMVIVSAGFLVMLGLGSQAHYATVLLPATIVCLGLGMGTAYPMYTIGSVTGVDPEHHGVAAGMQNTALQLGAGIGLAVVSAAVSAGLGGARTGEPLLHALRVGVIVGAVLPLVGAAITFIGLRSPARDRTTPATGSEHA